MSDFCLELAKLREEQRNQNNARNFFKPTWCCLSILTHLKNQPNSSLVEWQINKV